MGPRGHSLLHSHSYRRWNCDSQKLERIFTGLILLPKFNYMPLKLVHVTQNLYPVVFEKLLETILGIKLFSKRVTEIPAYMRM
jgi:hypothetical protein